MTPLNGRKEINMEVKEIVSIVKSVNKFAETIKTNKTKFSDVLLLTKLDSTMSDDISNLKAWLSVHEPTVQTMQSVEDNEPWVSLDPEAEWVKNNVDNLMVSSSGLFWSLDQNTIIKPRFVGGDLRIDFPNGDAKRAAVIVAKTFRLWSYDRNSDECIMWFKDGDHRNIAISNLVWKKRSELSNISAWGLLIEDICRRIIEHNCDVEKILECYEGSDPVVDKILIKRIIRKEKYSDISDRFFVLSGDTIVPREDIITNEDEADEITHTSLGYDIAAFLLTTGDKVIARQLLIDKIKEKQTISEDEKTMIVFSAIEQIGGNKKPTSRTIGKKINEIYDVTMPFDVIDNIITNGSRTIADLYTK